MGTKFIRTNHNLGLINTTKVMIIGVVESTLTIGSGNVALELTNLGPQTIMYGDTAVLVNSGGIITGNGSKFWDSVVGNFQLRLVTSTGSSNLIIHEYAGN